METKVFDSYQAFFNYLNEDNGLKSEGSVLSFIGAVSKINKGCGCAKKARIKKAQIEYLTLSTNLTPDFIEKLKLELQVQKVQFLQDEGLFLEV
tara:strand:+ start:557 stop:838 length:282 start_codon:yes stop_codon:yes gene_type:complete